MKLFVFGIFVSVVSVVSILGASTSAQQTTMTDGHIAVIRSNCPAALATLTRIHANDAPAYINRNQTYYSISDKLMARFNARLSVNRFDSGVLVKTSSDYNTQLAAFRSDYRRYDEAMSALLKIDCQLQPVTFYDKLREVRELRATVHQHTVRLQALISEYDGHVTDFAAQVRSKR